MFSRLIVNFDRAARGISLAGAVAAAVVIVIMVLHILLEIVLRAVFDTSTFVLDEFVGYGVAAATFLALGYTLEHGAMIRVSLLTDRLSNALARRGIELLVVALTLAVTLFVGRFFLRNVVRAWERGSTSESLAEVPLWIPEGVVVVGLAIFVLQLFAYALRVATGGRLVDSPQA